MKGKRIIRTLICALLALSLTSFTACAELFGGEPTGGTPSIGGNGEQTEGGKEEETPPPEDGGETGKEEEEPLVLPIIPEAPEEEVIVLPEKLDFTPTAVTKQYGYRYFANMENGDIFCRFYIDLYNAACGLSTHTDVEKMTAGLQGGGTIEFYAVDRLDYGKYGLTDSQAVSIWKTFRMEYPEFYWLDNQVAYGGGGILFLQIFEEYALGATRVALKTKIEAMAEECYSYLDADMTATEMALTIYDYVIASTQYAFNEDGAPEEEAWAHNIVGIADGGKGVCETYAKAFEYLCSLIGVDAVTVGGDAGMQEENMGGHAWNIVKLDGVWYNVDATWGDNDTLVLREWFGKNATEFNKTHIADVPVDAYGVNWQYELPTISEKNLSPVLMRENDGKDRMYGCIDYAFSDMLNAQSEYTITLYPHTSVTEEANLTINLTGASFECNVLPEVSLINFVGRTEGTTYNKTMAELTAENAFRLSGNMHLKDMRLIYLSINYNGYSVSKESASLQKK